MKRLIATLAIIAIINLAIGTAMQSTLPPLKSGVMNIPDPPRP